MIETVKNETQINVV